jgi:hypothetical protein
MTYGIILWGNFGHSTSIFRLQKKIIRIVMGIRNKESCRKHFRELKILTLKSQYSLSLFVINNRHHLEANSELHIVNIRTKYDLHKFGNNNIS